MIKICPRVMFLPVSHSDVLASVPQGFILEPLSDGLQCNSKLFADDASLFATVHNMKKPVNDLSHDLQK